MSVCVHVCVPVHVCTYMCIHVRACVCMCVYVCVHGHMIIDNNGYNVFMIGLTHYLLSIVQMFTIERNAYNIPEMSELW